MHSHVGRSGRYRTFDDQDRYLRIMDAAGIDMTAVSCPITTDHRMGNDRVADFVARRPDRFIGAAFLTPHYPEESIPELERAFDTLGMRFLKIYPDTYGKPIEDPAYASILEWANDRGIPVKSHATFVFDKPSVSVPKRFEALSRRYPRISWILAHAGSSDPPRTGPAVEATRAGPSVYLETASSSCAYGTIEAIVAGAGADRVLYGSDMPLHDARLEIGKILCADIPDDAKRKVLGLNTMRLLRLEGP